MNGLQGGQRSEYAQNVNLHTGTECPMCGEKIVRKRENKATKIRCCGRKCSMLYARKFVPKKSRIIPDIKKCMMCGVSKQIMEFPKDITKRDGHRSYCRTCDKEYQSAYREKNRKALSLWSSRYYHKKIKHNRKNLISRAMSANIRNSLECGKQGRRWEFLVGYSVDELKSHLSSLFRDGMSWENYGRKGWTIDHIKPISSFKYTSFLEKEFMECWSLNNLQPLWWWENRAKSNKISAT